MWRAFRGFSSAARTRHNSALHPDLAEELRREQDEYELGPEGRPKDNFERTAAALMEMDFGEYRKGILGGWGIDKRDATADIRLVEFCLSLPTEMLMKDGVRRPLARAALADRLPATILQEKKKGYQAAGWHREMTRDLPAMSALIDRMAADDVAARLLDIPALRQWVREWPSEHVSDPVMMARYRTALPQALAVGAFVLAQR
jgi:asparagine synthase (glutamine-hydrolysing)